MTLWKKSPKTRRATAIAAIALGVFALPGCRPPASPGIIYFNTLADEVWWPTQRIEISPFELDSAGAAALRPDSVKPLVWVRYNSKAPRSVSIIVEQEGFTGPLGCDTVEVEMYALDGHPLGRGTYGLYEASAPLPVRLPLPEGIVISLYPRAATPGILEAGATMLLRDSSLPFSIKGLNLKSK